MKVTKTVLNPHNPPGSSDLSSQNDNAGKSSGGNASQNDSGGASLEISGKRGTQNIGIAVFKKDKYVGQLSETDSISHLLITNNVDSFVLSIPNEDYPDNFMDLSVSPTRSCTINVDTSTNSPTVSISLFCEAKLLTIEKDSNYSNPHVLEILSDHAEKFLKHNIESYLQKTSQVFNSDIADFGKHALINFLTISDWTNYDWASKYSNTNFNVDVNISITSSLLFSQAINY